MIASPARPDDAAAMLRTCVAAARVDGSVCAFLEPIALYHTRDLYEEGDGLLARDPVAEPRAAGIGPHLRRRPRPDDPHLGQWPADVVASRPPPRGARNRGPGGRSPLARAAADRGHRPRGGCHPAGARRRRDAPHRRRLRRNHRDAVDAGYDGQLARVTSKDSFIPLGDAANLVLLSEDEIEAAAVALV